MAIVLHFIFIALVFHLRAACSLLQVLFSPDTAENEVALTSAAIPAPLSLQQSAGPIAACAIDCRSGAAEISAPEQPGQRNLSGSLAQIWATAPALPPCRNPPPESLCWPL